MAYEYQEFPKWTRNGKEERIVHSRKELDALGAGWSDDKHTPPKLYIDTESFQHYPKWVDGIIVNNADEERSVQSKFVVAQNTNDIENERETLIQIAEESGVKIDKRWSVDKIRAALEAV